MLIMPIATFEANSAVPCRAYLHGAMTIMEMHYMLYATERGNAALQVLLL